MQRDLEIDLLRAFVAVASHESFTRAAAVLGRTQSAISMQIKRLEEIVQLRLFERTKKSVTITREGETLLVYAKRILRVNDEALSCLSEPEAGGLIRIGAPDDYATCIMPGVLSSLSKAHPRLRLEISCDNGADLLGQLVQGELDLVVATHALTDLSGEVIRREPLHWVSAPGFHCDDDEPLPLVLYPQGCVCRALALSALDKLERPWRVAYSTRSIALINDAVASGAGVTVMEAATIPEGAQILDGEEGYPALPEVAICLHRRAEETPATTLAAAHLARELRSGR